MQKIHQKEERYGKFNFMVIRYGIGTGKITIQSATDLIVLP
jgi:hypothetical protein